jgi:hypothetical protein
VKASELEIVHFSVFFLLLASSYAAVTNILLRILFLEIRCAYNTEPRGLLVVVVREGRLRILQASDLKFKTTEVWLGTM